MVDLSHPCCDLRVSSCPPTRALRITISAEADVHLLHSILPLLAAKTGLVSLLLSLPYYPRELAFSAVDGFSRIVGITTFGVDTVLAHPNAALRNSPWAMVLVATIAGGGGGMIVPAFKGFHADWSFTSTPGWVKDGPGIDIWGATLIGYVYS